MGISRAHLNVRHVAKADAALAMAITVANQQKIDKANNAAITQTDNLLNYQHQRWQNTVNDARTALFLASQLYDEVMAAQVKPSVFDAVFKTLLAGLAVLNPELGMFAAILQLGSEGEKADRQERAKRIMGGVDLFKEAIKEGMEAQEAGEKIERHETTLKAKSKVIQEKIEEFSETSEFLTTAYQACKNHVDKLAKDATGPISDTALQNVERAWYALVGGQARHYQHGMDTELAHMILYEMMREYCKQNVRLQLQVGAFKIPISKTKAQQMIASGDGSTIEFEGLDPAKREAMYDKFEDVPDSKKQPKITKDAGGWKALINNWDFAS
jgi:hypothetical protein